MRAVAPYLVGILCALSGCVSHAPAGEDHETGAPVEGQPDGEGKMPEQTPAWERGDWWRWEIVGRNFGTIEVTTVVVAVLTDAYVMGATERGPALQSQVLHVPPTEYVDKADLGWLTHGLDTHVLSFPLSDGKTWDGEFEGMELRLVATSTSGPNGYPVFQVESTINPDGGTGPRFTYDPILGQFTDFEIHYGGQIAFSSMRLIDHGRDFSGPVYTLVPSDKYYGGQGGIPNLPTPPVSFTAAQEKVWLVFGCYLGGNLGHYGITFVTPMLSEEPVQCGFDNSANTAENILQVPWRASIPGEWTIAFITTGQGYADAEVLGVVETACELGNGTTADLPRCPD